MGRTHTSVNCLCRQYLQSQKDVRSCLANIYWLHNNYHRRYTRIKLTNIKVERGSVFAPTDSDKALGHYSSKRSKYERGEIEKLAKTISYQTCVK